jgi:hypothetical protein
MDEEIVIYATKYLGKLAKLVQDTDKRVLANYILMRFIRHRINNLDKRYTSQPSGSVFNTFRFLLLWPLLVLHCKACRCDCSSVGYVGYAVFSTM